MEGLEGMRTLTQDMEGLEGMRTLTKDMEGLEGMRTLTFGDRTISYDTGLNCMGRLGVQQS